MLVQARHTHAILLTTSSSKTAFVCNSLVTLVTPSWLHTSVCHHMVLKITCVGNLCNIDLISLLHGMCPDVCAIKPKVEVTEEFVNAADLIRSYEDTHRY